VYLFTVRLRPSNRSQVIGFRGPFMRRILVVATSFFALAAMLSAQQHVATPSASSAPIRSSVAAPAPTHVAPVTNAAPVHTPVASHPVSRVPVSNVIPVVPHRRTVPTPSPSHPIIGGTGNPGHGNPHSHCNQHFSYPIQGLSACPPPVTPVFGGAYFIPVPYYYSDAAIEDQELPQSDVEQEAAAQENATDQPETNSQESESFRNEREPVAESHARSAPSNINDSLAQFVFVQRDGSKLLAVAYSFLNDKLHYVTKEGVRHSVALNSLDLEATQKSNEQLGNTINLPNVPASGVALNITPTALQ
jgi:hypothetical protein